jgi:hypothetical protein
MAQEAQLVRLEGGELEAYQIGQASADDYSRAYWSIATPEKLELFAALIEERIHTNNKTKWYWEGYEAGAQGGRKLCIDILKRLHERQGPETAHNYYLYAARVIKARGQP